MRLECLRCRASTSRAIETKAEKLKRLEFLKKHVTISRMEESEEDRDDRLFEQRLRQAYVRGLKWTGKENSAFNYIASIDYESDDAVFIGNMLNVCKFCLARKFDNEPARFDVPPI